MELNKKVVSPVLAGFIIIGSLGVGFGGGVWYQKRQAVSNFRERIGNNLEIRQNGNFKNNQTGASVGAGQGMMRGGAITGEITAKDDKSITIKTADGSSKIILINNETKYAESTQASKDELSVGTKIAVFGETVESGSIEASQIEINPSFRGQQN